LDPVVIKEFCQEGDSEHVAYSIDRKYVLNSGYRDAICCPFFTVGCEMLFAHRTMIR